MSTTMGELRERLLDVRYRLRSNKDRAFEKQVRFGMAMIQGDKPNELEAIQLQYLQDQRLIEVGGNCCQSKTLDPFPLQCFYPVWHAVEPLKHSPVVRSSDIGSPLIGNDGRYPPEFAKRLDEFCNLAIDAAGALHHLRWKSDWLEDEFSAELWAVEADERLWLRAMFEFAWDRPDGGSPKVLREVVYPEQSQPYEWEKQDRWPITWRLQNADCFFSVISDAAEVSIQLIDWLICNCGFLQSVEPNVGLRLLPCDEGTPHEQQAKTLASGEGAEHHEVPVLSEKQYLILETMKELDAMSADSRRTAVDIAKACDGKKADVNVFKPLLSDLTKRGLTKSKTGSGGGSWLTPKGIDVANSLLNNRKARVSKR